MSSTSSTEEPLQMAAAADLASLARVSHRLALVDTTEKLQTVLDKLLPRLLQRIGDNHRAQLAATDLQLKDVLTKIHFKLVEMLSHTMKRVRHDQACKLNASAMVSLLLEEDKDGEHLAAKDCDAFSLNLSLAFLTLAIPRCSSDDLEEILPGLLVLHAAYEKRVDQELLLATSTGTGMSEATTSNNTSSTQKQWHQVSHLLLRTLERIIVEEEAAMKEQRSNNNNKRMKTASEEKKDASSADDPLSGLDRARQLILQDSSVAASTYDLILDALLYTTQAGNVPPGGLSSVGWQRLKDGNSSTERDWAAEMAPLNRLTLFKTRLVEWVAPSRRWGLFLGKSDNWNPRNSGDNNDCSSEVRSTSREQLGVARTLAILVVASGDAMQSVAEASKQYLKQYFGAKRNTRGFGDADRLCKELLSLSVGKINAAMAFVTPITASLEDPNGLGRLHADVTFQRRQVSESHYAELVGMSTKAFDDTSEKGIVEMGKLVILSSDKMLSKLANALGLNNQRGKPFVLAAEQLSALTVRMERCNTQDPTIYDLYARSLNIALRVLNPIAATKVLPSSSSVSESHVSVRDSIYGSVATLSRSSFAKDKFFCLMAGGNSNATTLSTDLIHLLFRCVGNEVDRLRPRATAALDAVLFACRRATEVTEHIAQFPDAVNANPWSRTSTQQDVSMSGCSELPEQLARSILPLLWAASRATQPRQSRIAASRWSSDLLVNIDVVSATHILCFLAGDADVTAAAIARDGLGLSKEQNARIADFGEICDVVLSDGNVNARPTFWDFSSRGKSATLKCLLRSFLDDFHGDGVALQSFLKVVTETLSSKDEMSDKDLQDTCSEAILACVGVSCDARKLIVSSSLCLGIEDLRKLALSANSSMARRFLSEAFGKIMEDKDIFETTNWNCLVAQTIEISFSHLKMQPLKPCSETHGAALLGGTLVSLVRKNLSSVSSVTFIEVSQIMANLGEGILHMDESVANVCADGILAACSEHAHVSLPERYENLLSMW
jgi:proteasome component ECM29